MKGLCSVLAVGLLALVIPGRGQAGEAYFVVMFAAQRTPNEPEYSHSFATFVRVTWPDYCPTPTNYNYESHTISWMPVSRDVQVLNLHPECGCNFDLHTTILTYVHNRSRVSMWGPYQIAPELYHSALKEIAYLDSGKVLYKAMSGHRINANVCNCSHALMAAVDGPKMTIASPGWGDKASRFILEHKYRPWIVDPDRTFPWVATLIGLDYYPVVRR
jgi:hypothetical protein